MKHPFITKIDTHIENIATLTNIHTATLMTSHALSKFIEQYNLERINGEYEDGKYTYVEYRMKFAEPVDNDTLRSAIHLVRVGKHPSTPYIMYPPFSKDGRYSRIYVNLKGWNTQEIQKEVLDRIMDVFKPYQIRAKVSYRS